MHWYDWYDLIDLIDLLTLLCFTKKKEKRDMTYLINNEGGDRPQGGGR